MHDIGKIRDKILGQTQRLILRPFKITDSNGFFEFLSHKETCYSDGGYQPFCDMDEAYFSLMEQFLQEDGRIVLEEKNSGRVVGTIKISPSRERAVKALELGYVTSPYYRRKGFCFEALSFLKEKIFSQTDIKLLVVKAEIGNIQSQGLALKLGFEREGIITKGFYHPEKGAVDMVSFCLEKPLFE